MSDQWYYYSNGRWFTNASFPLDRLANYFDFVSSWVFWGRLQEIDEARTINLYEIPFPKGRALCVEGPWNPPRGPLGYIKSFLFSIRKLYALIDNNDIIWLKHPYFFSMLAQLLLSLKRRNHYVISQTVGDVKALTFIFGSWWLPVQYLLGYFVRKAAEKANLAIFVSKALAKRFGSKGSKILIVNECRVTEDMLSPIPDRRTLNDPPRILYVGRFSPEKGVEVLIHAFAALQKKLFCRLVMVGDGPLSNFLRQLSHRLGVAHLVEFPGKVRWGNELFKYMRSSDVLVLPSFTEGLALVLLEAMMNGLPVIATCVGGIPEIVDNGRSGLLVSPGNPDEIVAAILRLFKDAQLRVNLVNTAYGIATHYTFDKQMHALSQVVRKDLALHITSCIEKDEKRIQNHI